jgi:hypothetical protein
MQDEEKYTQARDARSELLEVASGMVSNHSRSVQALMAGAAALDALTIPRTTFESDFRFGDPMEVTVTDLDGDSEAIGVRRIEPLKGGVVCVWLRNGEVRCLPAGSRLSITAG